LPIPVILHIPDRSGSSSSSRSGPIRNRWVCKGGGRKRCANRPKIGRLRQESGLSCNQSRLVL